MSTKNMSWDTDSVQVVLDNSATTHIWNNLNHFEVGSLHYFEENEVNRVLTIGDRDSIPIGTEAVSLNLKDSEGVTQLI